MVQFCLTTVVLGGQSNVIDACHVSEALLEELHQRGEAIYENQLKTQLERDHDGEYVVIHVDTGDFAVAKLFTLAHHKMLALRLPGGRMYGRKIGSQPDNDFVAHMVAVESIASQVK